METRELSSERHTDSELDLGESGSPEQGSTPPRLPFGLSVRGLQGTAAVLGFVTIVSAAVIGGALAVDSVARWDGDRPDGSALLNDSERKEAQLDALPPSPEDDAPAVEDEKAGQGDGEAPKPKSGKESGDQASGSGEGRNDSGGKQVDQVKSEKKAPKAKAPAPLASMGIIRNLATGQCIDLPAADVPAVGTAVNQYNCIPGPNDNQDFELVEQFGELMLRNLKTNYCLDLPGTGSVKPGAVVIVSPCQSGDTENQMFRAEPQTDGYYLRHVKSGLCLDVDGAGDDERNRPGQLLTVYTCSPDDDHIWTVG
ncbi:RICIN domain-containing protein [Kineosporia babensis]|uniref:RICIN domain-containing protein n=1 Tax=Kineosporia babensis TaxID=499548 RepID=A0A9X1SXH6_9ACTN|nr:RICIN domain-containing protein [Kineosporia babensis]